MQQAVFYEYICEGKSSTQAMICCGTNVILRRDALMQVGGLDESTVTEDFATSIKLHLKGWQSLYYNHVYTFGMGPEDLGSYFKQQNRWAMGNVGVLRKIIWQFIKSPLALRPAQWFEYFITGSYYLIAWAYLFLVFCPVAYIFFNIPSFFMNPVVYSLSFLPYLVLSIAIFEASMVGRRYSVKEMFKGQLLSFITLPVYLRASLFGLFGVKGTFQVTAKGSSQTLSYFQLWPQLVFWGINLIALTWGLNRLVYEPTPAILMNNLWIAYHLILFSGIFYFNEEKLQKIPCQRLAKKIKFAYEVVEKADALEPVEADTWKNCLSLFLPQRLAPGSLVLFKLTLAKEQLEPIIFEARVITATQKKGLRGFGTNLGIVTIADLDRERLKETFGK